MFSRLFLTSLLLEATAVSAFPDMAERLAASHLGERGLLDSPYSSLEPSMLTVYRYRSGGPVPRISGGP